MKQIVLELDVSRRLPNGDIIDEGDFVECSYGPYITHHKVFEHDGRLCLDSHHIHGDKPSITGMLNASCCTIKKISLVEIYKVYKENGWSFEWFIINRVL